jgi:uncharacterized protein YidB (DUF937 family)
MGLLDILNGMQNGPRGQPQPKSGSGGMSPITMALIGLLAYKALKSFGGSQPGTGGGGDPSGGIGSGRPSSLPGSTGNPSGGGSGGLGDILGGLLGGKTPSGGGLGNPSAGGSGGLGDILGGLLGGKTPSGSGLGNPSAGGSGGLGDILGGLLGGKTPSGSSLNDLVPGGAGSVLNGGLGSLIRDLQNNGHGRVAQSWVDKGPNEEIEPNDLAKALGADTISALTKETGMSRDDLLEGLSQQLPEMVDKLTPDGRLPTEQEARRWV